MTFRLISLAGVFALLLTGNPAWSQSPAPSAGTSNYIFRYARELSQLMMKDMKFSSQSPLPLDTCTTTEQINGPIHCAMNCTQQPVCLYLFQGPAGLSSADVFEKVNELPNGASSPTPLPSIPSLSSLSSAYAATR